MSLRRSYGSYNDGCASAHALDLIGERWALIIVRELLLGPKRFADLERDIPGIGPTILSQRLRELEAVDVLVRRALPPPAERVTVYAMTEWGSALEQVNLALSMWAVRSPRLPVEADMSPDTLVLAMRAHARALPATEGPFRVSLALVDSRTELEVAPTRYLAELSTAGTTVIKEHRARACDAEVSATTRAWKACVLGGLPISHGEVEVTGEPRAAEALLAATRLLIDPGPSGASNVPIREQRP